LIFPAYCFFISFLLFRLQLFYICRESSGRDDKRLHHQTSQLDAESVPIPPDSGIFKTQDGTAGATVSANGEIDFGNVDLSQMDPEVIRVMFHVNFSASFQDQRVTQRRVFYLLIPVLALPRLFLILPSAFRTLRFRPFRKNFKESTRNCTSSR
jgi:hypothetical protein